MKILYKIGAMLLALCVLPAAIFPPLVRIVGSISVSTSQYLSFQVSAWKLFNFFNGRSAGESFGYGSLLENEAFLRIKPILITFVVFFALAIVFALVIFFFALFSRMRKTIACLSVGGAAMVLGMFISFARLAAPFAEKSLTLGQFFTSTIVRYIVDLVGEISNFEIAGAGYLMLFAFIASFVWSISFVLIEIGEPKKAKPGKIK